MHVDADFMNSLRHWTSTYLESSLGLLYKQMKCRDDSSYQTNVNMLKSLNA